LLVHRAERGSIDTCITCIDERTVVEWRALAKVSVVLEDAASQENNARDEDASMFHHDGS
jgi:hypothetical protein